MEANFTHRQVTSMADSSDVAGRDDAGAEKLEASGTVLRIPDEDSFKLMMDHKRSVVKISLFIGMPLFSVMAIKNFITGDHFMAFTNCMVLLILILLGFVIMRKIEEKSEYKIYSILFRLFFAVMGVSLFYDIGFQSNFSRIEWCYIYPILVFFAVGVKEGMVWVSIFYGILAFLILNFDLQGVTLFQIQELRTRFLVSFFAVCMLSLFLEQGFRRAQQRLLHHQRILKESENRYRQAYEKLNIEMQDRKRAEEALLNAAQQWRTTFDGISDIVCLLDLEGRILRCNKAMVNLLRKPFSEIIGRPHWEIIHGTTAPIKESPFERMKETRCRETAILPIGDRWFNIAVDPLLDEVGGLLGTVHIMSDITERKRADEALRRSEEKYRTILENIQDGYLEVDLAGNFTFVNDAQCRNLGYTREELIRMNNRQYTDQTTARKLYQTFNEVYRTGEPVKVLDLEVIRKDGTKAFNEISVSLIRDSEGKPIGFRGISRDVTERKRAEETLRESEDCYRDLVEFSQHLICTHDLRGQILSVNQEGAKLLGYEQRSLLNKNIRDLLVPEVRDEFDTYLDTIQKHGVAKGLMSLQTATGEKRLWEYNNTLRTEGVTVPIVRAIAHDVTEHIRAEKAVTRLSQENAIMAEIGRIISSTLNIEEVYERFAEEVRKLIPFDRIVINVIDTEKSTVSNVYMAGKGIADRKVEEIYPLKGSGNAEMLRTQSSFLIQTEDFNEYKDRFPMLLSTFQAGFRSIMNVPLFSKGQVIGGLLLRSLKPYTYTDKDVRLAERVGNQIAGAIANAQLFIERKRAEEERTALQEQLRQSQKMEAVGQLAGGIAHDFNNLLTVITGYSDMILRRLNQNDSMRGNAEEIQRAAEKAASLTRQLLAFSRKQMLQSKVLDLNNLVTNMDKMLQRLIGENIDLITLSAKDLGRIKADPGQIEQVLLNLVVNAKDAMPSSGKLTIEMANVELDENYARSHINVKPGCYVMLSVSDTGCGMPPEIREKIFEPFFTTKEKGKGTGLGLSTVYGIVKQSEGSIYVYSEPGRGTTFKIYFPRIEEVTESIEPGAKITKSFQGSETILLVEDEEMVRRLARTILQDNGYNVLEASNGEEALRIAQEHGAKQIHLMVTDVVMPRMSGRELADCLESVRPEMKVLYISGYTDDAIIRHGVLEQGMAFIQKPFTPDALVRKVRNVLDKSQQEQQSFSEIPKEGVIQKDGLQTSEKHERNSGQTDRRLLS